MRNSTIMLDSMVGELKCYAFIGATTLGEGDGNHGCLKVNEMERKGPAVDLSLHIRLVQPDAQIPSLEFFDLQPLPLRPGDTKPPIFLGLDIRLSDISESDPILPNELVLVLLAEVPDIKHRRKNKILYHPNPASPSSTPSYH